MDKPTGNRISIKINGEERNLGESSSKKPKNLDQVDENTSRKEVAASKEVNERDEFHWVLPIEGAKSENTPKNIISIDDIRTIKTKKKNSSIKSKASESYFNKNLLFIILLAIVIGIGFGMVILNLVSKDIMKQEQGSGPVIADSLEDTSSTQNSPSQTNNVEYQLKPLTAYVVQAGVFSTLDSAKQFSESIKNSGYPTTFFNKDKYFLFIGIGLNEADVKEMGVYYHGLGLETYSKAYVIGGKTIKVKNNEISENLDSTTELFEQLLNVTAEEINGVEYSNEKWNEFESKYNNIHFSLFDNNDHFKKYVASIENAYKAYANYRKSNKKGELFQSQQALLDALKAYDEL